MNDIEQKISKYFKNERGIIAVYLFGSYASNRQRPMSDVDIGIVVDFNILETIKEQRNRYVVDLSGMLRKDIHFVFLNGSGESLMAQVFKKGKCLLIRKPKELSVFKMRMYAMIADFGYYKNMIQPGLIRSIMEA